MRKIIAAINMTIDGFCDHTGMIADEELHIHYTQMLQQAGVLVYGRVTYQLMENYWPGLVKNPSGIKSMDAFATAIQGVQKIVFSRTFTQVEWENTRLATRKIEEELVALKQETGNDIFVGSPGLIDALTKLQLIDEYQLCMHPVIGNGHLRLFKNVPQRRTLQLIETKTFESGAVILYYQSGKKNDNENPSL